ncbi:hypothetical protein [Nitrococcus mobilis]|uniref:DUF2157 domain-containing protein n=1 Tax=Nitrococcus mobilis Nb-231 TaxID=314278 RepID=A4BSQ9_9GAMM|nr:hypothetical protein [Nitrococcus mobilis]EAR21329.1 hypothetical protein NB231_08730 [Nitrococcus mobilis Nb-231]
MRITRQDLIDAVDDGTLTRIQAELLWTRWQARGLHRPRFDFSHVAWYLGALIVISAMGWFMTEAWMRLGGAALTAIAILYAIGFVAAGHTLYFRQGQSVSGGLLFTLAVCMTPLAIFGIEHATGFWPQGDPGEYAAYFHWIKGSWLLMEVGTIVVGALALRWVRFPFLVAPIAFTLWYLSMDLTPLLFGKLEFAWHERLWVSLWFGLAMLLVAWFVDRRTREDYAFWLYLFGLIAFWGGLSLMDSDNEFSKLFYCLINVALMGFSLLLQRRVFMVFGAVGVFGYIGHLAQSVFRDSLLFPVTLTLVGLGVIWAGLLHHRHGARWEAALQARMPTWLGRLSGRLGSLDQ